jgi:hypothetical protein
MFAANQRNGVTESATMCLDESRAVLVFFDGHSVEDLRRLRKVGAKTLRVPPVNPRVIFLRGNRERESLLFRQVLELPSMRNAGYHAWTSEL